MATRTITFRDAVNEAMRLEMRRDPTVILFGEDVAGGATLPHMEGENKEAWGGVLGVTKGLASEFGRNRVLDTPISESAFIGAAVGAASTGLRPVAELMFVDFMGVCFDQIFNQGAKLRYMFGGKAQVPMVVRTMIGAGFRADLGFMPQVDYKHREVGLGYQWNATEESWYSRLDLKTKIEDTVDQSGFLLFHEDVVQFTVEGPLQSHSVVRLRNAREGYNRTEFDVDQVRLHLCAKPNAHSHAWLNLTTGDAIDYVNTRPSEVLNLDGGFWYRFGRHLYIEPTYTRERMDVDQGWLYTATIGQLAASWQFNPRCFVRAILQHVDNKFNAELYSDDRGSDDRGLFTQYLFSYKLNPRTVLFFGYSDNSTATQDYGMTLADRTIFAKIGYAWVF